MIELSVNNVMKYFGANLVLKDINFTVQQGERVGLVGRNGSGKTTALKLITGIETKDKGDIAIRKGATVGYLEQMPSYEDGSTVEMVLNTAFNDLDLMEKEMSLLEEKMKNLKGDDLEKVLKQYSYIQQVYEVKGGYDREEKLSRVCLGLKFQKAFLEKPFHILSGGEKTTAMLGKILLENPDILILDEPTNHLDMEALEWFEEYLKTYKGTVIVVSHDRYFLDNVVTKIVEFEDLLCTTYEGNYSEFIRQKEEKMILEYEAYKVQQKKVDAMEKSIKNLRDWAMRGDNEKFFKRAASMQKRLDKMDKLDKPDMEKVNMKINITTKGRSGGEVIKVEGASKSFQEKELFIHGDMLIRYKDRVAFIGPNGSGKSTLLKILLGEETVDNGSVEFGANVKVAYLPQVIEFNDDNMTVLQFFRENIEILEGKAREYLAKFMFFGESVFKKVGSLSGGEKSRLMLSKLLFNDINLLVLDEPTNHLDIDSIETLEEALLDFTGTILFVSHDRYFINNICERVVALEDKKFIDYCGNYDYYRMKNNEKKKVLEEKVVKKEKLQKVKVADEEKQKEAKRKKLEEKIEILENSLVEIEIKINAFQSEYDELNKYYNEKMEMERELEVVMEQWVLVN
ncbi:ABC-F type ribosomal protection protein [Clostridium sp.]|uniref:ribosomal protection-like ABC-F family protein n=1 Tax=Clostridium sp. TaxID=1506 RepID=UPI002FC6EE17